jgi:hypothetical protein
MTDAQAIYTLWLAAMARGDIPRARNHAEVLRQLIRDGHEPDWSIDARASFYVWCGESRARREKVRP